MKGWKQGSPRPVASILNRESRAWPVGGGGREEGTGRNACPLVMALGGTCPGLWRGP